MDNTTIEKRKEHKMKDKLSFNVGKESFSVSFVHQLIEPENKTATICILTKHDPLEFFSGVAFRKFPKDDNDELLGERVAFKRAVLAYTRAAITSDNVLYPVTLSDSNIPKKKLHHIVEKVVLSLFRERMWQYRWSLIKYVNGKKELK